MARRGEAGVYAADAETVAVLASLGAFAVANPFVPWEGTPLAMLAVDASFVRGTAGVALLTALLAAVACGLVALGRGAQRLSRPLAWTACGLYAGSCVALEAVGGAAGALGFALPPFLAAVIGIPMGAGLLGVALAWVLTVSAWDFRTALVRVSVTCALASGVCLLWASGVLPGASWAFAPCAVAGAGAPFALARRDGLRGGATTVDDAVSGHLWASMRAMVLTPYLGLFLFVFDLSARNFAFMGQVHIGLWSVAVGGAALLALASWWPRFSLLAMQRAVLPTMAAVFLVLTSFPVGTGFFSAGYMVSHVLMAMVALLAMAALCAVARAGEFPSVFIGGIFVAIVALATILGAGLNRSAVKENDLGVTLLVCSVSFFVYALLAPALEGYRALRSQEPADVDRCQARLGRAGAGRMEAGCEGAGGDGSSPTERACDRLADRCGLSARERELLPHLARGHRPVFVAEQLCISESTARTHVRNIYRKLGIGSSEELIELVDKERRTESDS